MNRNRFLGRTKARALLFGMVAAMLTIGTTLFAQSAESDFTVTANDDGTVTITRYEGWDSVVNIPAAIGGKAVTAIGEEAFAKQENLTGVTIPDSVTSIGESAFADNKLTSVTFGKGLVTIGKSAFANNKLAGVIFSKGLVTIKENAFYNNNLTSITLPDTIKFIGERAFSHNLLASITIPGFNTRIGKLAFARNKQLASVTLGSCFAFDNEDAHNRDTYTYTSISFSSFVEDDNEGYPSDWETNNIGERGKNLFWDYVCNDRKAGAYTPDLKYRAPKKDGDFEYIETRYGAALTKYTGTATAVRIPEKVKGLAVKYLHRGIFDENRLERVLIPNSVTSIGAYVFCSKNMTSFTIPNSVTYIGDYAFAYNDLTNVVIPDSVTYIGDNAFEHNDLTNVVIPDRVAFIGMSAFSYNSLMKSVTIGNGVTYIGGGAFNSDTLTSVTIGGGVTMDIKALPCRDVYNSNGKKAGVYTRENAYSRWTYAER